MDLAGSIALQSVKSSLCEVRFVQFPIPILVPVVAKNVPRRPLVVDGFVLADVVRCGGRARWIYFRTPELLFSTVLLFCFQ